MAPGPKLGTLRKEAEETFCFLFRGESLCVTISRSAQDTSLICFRFRKSSGSDARMGMGIVIGTFSSPFAIGRTPGLVNPDPGTFFFLGTGGNPWDLLLPLDRELAREFAPPLEELLMAIPWVGGLLLVLVAWVLGNSRFLRISTGTVRVGSTSGMGNGGWASEEASTGYVTGEGKAGDKGVSSSSLSDASPVISESPPPRVERVVEALRTLDPLGIVII